MKFILTFFLLFSFISEAKEFKYDLAIASIFQNEAPYMKEWIDYHRKVGVEHFILFNNNSDDDYASVLEPYIKSGVVELIQWPSSHPDGAASFVNFCFKVQVSAFNRAIELSKKTTKWLAMIDLDEFIVPVKDTTILECLEARFPDVGGVVMNWQCYGTSHVEKLDESRPMIHQLLWKTHTDNPRNLYGKSIVKPKYVKKCTQPHGCVFKKGYYSVDTAYRICEGTTTSVLVDTLRINHYWARDEWFLHQVKVPRYGKWGSSTEGILLLADELNQEYDPVLETFQIY